MGQRKPYRLQRAALVMSVFANAISLLVIIGALSVYSSCSRSSESLANAFPGDQPDVAYATRRCDDQSFCSEDMWDIALWYSAGSPECAASFRQW